MANVMAGDAEAAGAIAGMQETYGRPRFEEGQWVRGECFGKKFSGRVLEDFGDGICVEIDGGLLGVKPEHIHEPSPTGLPMDCLLADPTDC